jgi:hypothetical protein
MIVYIAAEIFPTLSPKFRRPTARPPRTTAKWSHERKVLQEYEAVVAHGVVGVRYGCSRCSVRFRIGRPSRQDRRIIIVIVLTVVQF